MLTKLRQVWHLSRRADDETQAALKTRWAELPEHVKTPAQVIGRYTTGCEGTHGVFPQCDFACKPCYHSKDANRVRIDGHHTVTEVEKQMTMLRSRRGPRQHCQLIGGEVSLLGPADHAATIEVMHRYGRVPMSFTHGDIDDDYVFDLAVDEHGKARFKTLNFAAHFDITMFGRRGIEKPTDELSLNPYRERFANIFNRLQREHGVRSYLAHNMTVTPGNIDQVAEVIRTTRKQGWRMYSFQPAAFMGNEVRWRDDYRAMTSDDVWAEVERGVGIRLPYKALQFGDLRCNRVTWGVWVGDQYAPLLDDAEPGDLAARDLFFQAFPNSNAGVPRSVMVLRALRATVRHPRLVPVAIGWARRFTRRAGGWRNLRRGFMPMTFVMHNFMDERDVSAAWKLLQDGVTTSSEPRIQETIERLQGCGYSMAHPDTGQLVPACAQHSVFDPIENRELSQLLPIRVELSKKTAQVG